jgi:NAD(P)-dependent dehydrogenase (short-subunit alcohol dehydrogenase family)
MLIFYYANLLQGQGFKVNALYPGYIGTNLNDHCRTGTIDEGAANLIRLATLDKNGETGTFSTSQGPRPW